MFLRASMDVGQTPPIETKEYNTAAAVVLGEALVLTDGKLTKCGAAVKPQYIAVGPGVNGMAQVIKVNPHIVFDTTLAAAGTALKLGNKVTLHTDAAQVTATTEGGVATIVAMEGTAVGDHVQVRFE